MKTKMVIVVAGILVLLLTTAVRSDMTVTFTDSCTTNSGQTYIRWGRTTCADGASLVYKGYTVGPGYSQPGSGGNYLCLTEEPEWLNHATNPNDWAAYIYGAEYVSAAGNNVYSLSNNAGNTLMDQPAPCAACYVARRSAVMMIPGRRHCPTGWNEEYRGYLAAGDGAHPGRLRAEYVCWDEAPEVADGAINQDQALVYPVRVGCGTLPCSRYPTGWEVTCVVCSK